MLTEREKMLQRIKKLKAHATSAEQLGNQAEAESFTLKYQELMLEYNISLMEVDAAADNTDTFEFKNWQYTERISYREPSGQAASGWLRRLITVLVKHNFCDVVFSSHAKTFDIWGHAENIDAVVYLYNYLSIAYFSIGKQMYQQNSHGLGLRAYLTDFLKGAVQGLDDKLYAQRRAQQRANPQVTALVKYNAKALDTYAAKLIPGSQHWTKRRGSAAPRGTAAFSTGVQVGRTHNAGEKLGGTGVKKYL